MERCYGLGGAIINGHSEPQGALADAIADDAERYADGHGGQHYVSLLKEAPSAAGIEAVEAAGQDGEVAKAGGRAVHLMLGPGYHTARLTNAAVEKHLGVATNRNLTVIRTLAEKWGG